MDESQTSGIAEVPREGESLEIALDSVDKESQVKEEKSEEPAESQTEKLELPTEEILKKNSAWEEMREKNEELEERLKALEPTVVERSDFVASLVGENDEVEKKWAEEKEALKEEVKREFIQEQLNAQEKEQKEKEYWDKWTSDRLTEVAAEYKVDFKSDESKRNELMKVMLDYSPTDEAGNLDYLKGMKILTELSKVKEDTEAKKVQVKKDIADATVSKEANVQANKGFLTSNDLRGKDWRSLVNRED